MARKSLIVKNKQRKVVVDRYIERRKELKKKFYDKSLDVSDRVKLQLEISRLPRDSSPVRLRNRCELTGRSRGCLRKFGLSRIKFRELALAGYLPGVIKHGY